MRPKLRAILTLTVALIVLITVILIGVLARIFINHEFEKYAREQQEAHARDIVANLSRQYDSLTETWNTGYVHGVGMYALHEGYVIRIYGKNGTLVWDAENHDMSLCSHVMTEIMNRMEEKRPDLQGGFSTLEYELAQNGQKIGKVAITSYGPYFFTDSDFRFLDALNLIWLVTGVLSLGFSLVAGWFLARRISHPIIKTAHIATQISHGNFGIRFKGRTSLLKVKELEELVTAVNHMAESLDNQENLRKRLTMDVAHELRTPLSAVSSHLEMMMEGVWEPVPQRLQSCFEEISRISGLVAELEKLAQLENGNLNLKKMPLDLLEIAYAVSGTLESESMKKNIAVRVEGESSIVPGDKDRIHQVLANLLSNAIKYTPDGGHVQVTVVNTPNNGIIKVKDDGIGIPENELPLIFERFYRTDKSRNRKTGGAGIGLTIAKSIVMAHGGHIDVTSTENGSLFTVFLPSLPKNSER